MLNSITKTHYKEYVRYMITDFFKEYNHKYRGKTPLFVCIGTPMIIGDSIGPLVGSMLQNLGYSVYGTISHPLSASNLNSMHRRLWFKSFVNTPIIAIDAAVNAKQIQDIGTISTCCGAGIYPGSGVGKDFDIIGNSAIAVYAGKDIDDLCDADPDAIQMIAECIASCIHEELQKMKKIKERRGVVC